MTPKHYARNFYRPAGHEQVEWTFPNSHKTNYFDRTLPETEALMRVMDDLEPALVVSLHNAGFGGVYYYLSRPLPGVYPTFHELPGWEELPLSLGEPEVPFAEKYAPAISKLSTTEDGYDYLEQNGGDVSNSEHGGSSAGYSAKYGTVTLITEMAYFDDPRVNDQTVTAIRRRDAILGGLETGKEVNEFVTRQLKAVTPDLKASSPFRTAVTSFNDYGKKQYAAQRQWAETDPGTDRPATVAELFSNNQESEFYSLLQLGMLVRLLEVKNLTITYRTYCGYVAAVQDVSHLGGSHLKAFRRRAQIIFQNPFEAFDPRLTIGASLEQALRIHNIGTNAERHKKIVLALESASLSPAMEFLARYPHELSGGQSQRIATVRAMLLEPDFLVADEPVSMLDVSVRADILNQLLDM